MNRHLPLVLIVLASVGLAFGPAHARPITNQAQEFELARIDGAHFVRLSDFPNQAVLVNFWSRDCPPCIEEIPLLDRMALRNPRVQFLGISVDQRTAAYRFLMILQPGYPQLLAPITPDGLARRLGNPTGALPYTVVLDRRHRLCRSHSGALDQGWLDSALKTCG